MNGMPFPRLALFLGVTVAGVLLLSGSYPGAASKLPLLTQLIVTEFGFFVTAVGAGIGVNKLQTDGADRGLLIVVICCAIMAAVFLYSGMHLWPGYVPT